MKVIRKVQDWITLRQAFGSDATIGYVPTMGALHQGHQSLLTRSRAENDMSVLSIFVNPKQFRSDEDYLRYPKPWEKDMAIASDAKVDYVFAPEYSDFYPENIYHVSELLLSDQMEGFGKPGMFQRTLTTVLKLLMLMRATNAYLGEKDYQQLLLIQGMARAFFITTHIIPCTTVRDAHGLPLSSRNVFLDAQGKLLAKHFAEIFKNTHLSTAEVVEQLKDAGIETEYMVDEQARRFCAVKIGNIRIIDNRSL